MNQTEFEKWNSVFENEISSIASSDDPAHDLLHFKRVTKLARKLCNEEGGNFHVVLPASWLHDYVIIPKSDPLRSKASRLSAQKALEFLNKTGYPNQYFADITHAIEAHSFSANIEAKTLEAKIVQDADRLDGLGAIGIARCFSTSGTIKRPLYNLVDPFCNSRKPDDLRYALDHFYQKLFMVGQTLQTKSGQNEGKRRLQFMHEYIVQLQNEIQLTNQTS